MAKYKNYKKCSYILSIYLLNFINNCIGSDSTCGEFEYQCHSNKKCISSSLVCDGKNDCDDSSDEEDCEKCLEPEWYECKDSYKSCIHHSFVCDGHVNCQNGSDEENCPASFRTSETEVCGQFEFTCDDKTCIPLDLVCDGRRHCPDNSDEIKGCEHAELKCEGFFCLNKRCLSSHSWVCDGINDCGDNSDEHGCAWNCNLNEHKFLCKDNDTCINLDKVCDNKTDCSDKSDENGLCNNEGCAQMKCPSQSFCTNLPTGPFCICPKGFNYNPMTNKCDDINECDQYGICSQLCMNTNGSYKCSCMDKFRLKNDNRSCIVEDGEPLLLFTTASSVIGIHLQTRHVYKVAEKLKQTVGVAYDGQHIYWTHIQSGHESITRAREDGSKKETLVTSGLEAPEDIALDWLTGNIYFTDNIMRHIAVCTNHGDFCKSLVHIDVDSPRGIALHPQNGKMFWSDWGFKPMIATADMDGSNVKPFITTKIKWPNCITIDYPSQRLYWVDGKLETIENVRLDGTDRRTILSELIKHPYGIAIFENNLYWSDWSTNSINVADKFNGKNHEVIFKDSKNNMYATHVYHSAIQPKLNHPCKFNSCSHICLLAGKLAKCACPNDMELNKDGRTCSKTKKGQNLYIAIGSNLYKVEHNTFGRHKVIESFPLSFFISQMEYNNINGTLFIADNLQSLIGVFDPSTSAFTTLAKKDIHYIEAIAFDHLTHNLYWVDSVLRKVEVLSLQTGKRALIHFFSGQERPVGLAVKPELGHIFVAVQSRNGSHIDTITAHGQIYRTYSDKFGTGEIQLYSSILRNSLYWLDRENARIEYASYENMSRKVFHEKLSKPYSMTIVNDNVFWSQKDSATIFWAHISGQGSIKRLEIDQPLLNIHSRGFHEIVLISNQPAAISALDKHKCLIRNGGCSHVCIATGSYSSMCTCPPGHVFKDNSNLTCIEAIDCELRCKSGECITSSRKCNGKNDCLDGSDEENCDEKIKKICRFDQFRCHDGTECIENSQRCDQIKTCSDGSDEIDCEKFDAKTKCRFNQFRCDNTKCIDITSVCDHFDDCGDFSDEKTCERSDSQRGCGKDYFQCTIGSCVPKKWECDGHIDCIDASDEHERCVHTCAKGFVQCRAGQCIDSKLICDGNDDCGDNSDENNCLNEKKDKIGCGEEEDDFGDLKKFQCTSNLNICLDITAKCNGTAECPRGEDETDCSTCSIYEFKCHATKQCIRNEWLCDGTKDCSDGSDELNCKTFQSNTSTNAHFHHTDLFACHDQMFSCRDGTCIEQSKVCDNNVDCNNGADEGALCETACKKSDECKQICTPTPYGAVCSCKRGYRLNRDKKTCSDIDECHESDLCAQICENYDGDFRCSCYSDFMLRTDKISCKSIEGDAYLLFSSFDQARIISENPISIKLAWSANESKIEGLEVDIRNKRAYFTLKDSNSIFEYNLNKTNTGVDRVLTDPGRKRKIALDWVTGNVYVVSNTGVDSIKVCNFNNKKCARIIKLRPRDSVKAIAVDAINRYLFYTITYFSIFGNPKTTLYKSSLDGQKTNALLSNTMYITSIEVDVYKQIVYFIDFHTKTLQSIEYNVNESSPKMIIKKENAIKNPTGLSIYENKAFIVNTGSPEAVKCDLYNNKNCEAFNINVYNAEDVIVVGASRQPKATNYCESTKCSVLCIHAELGAKCICYNGERSAVGETCPQPLTQTEFSSFEDIFVESGTPDVISETESSNSYSVVLCLIAITSLSIIGYIYYRVKFSKGDVSVNMHFQNPMSKNNNNQNNNNNNQQEILEQNPQYESSTSQANNRNFNSSPSVSTRFFKNDNKNIVNNFSSKLPMYGQIQKFFKSEKFNDISLESAETNRQNHSKIQSVKGSKSFTYKPGCLLEPSPDTECTSRDLGNFDDDPRARLVP